MVLFTAVFLRIIFAKAILSENNQLFYRFFGLSNELFTMSSKLTKLFSLFPASWSTNVLEKRNDNFFSK